MNFIFIELSKIKLYIVKEQSSGKKDHQESRINKGLNMIDATIVIFY